MLFLPLLACILIVDLFLDIFYVNFLSTVKTVFACQNIIKCCAYYICLKVPELQKITVRMKNPEHVKSIVAALRKDGAARLQVCGSFYNLSFFSISFQDICLFQQFYQHITMIGRTGTKLNVT